MVAKEGDEADGEHDGGKEQEEDVELAHAVCRPTLKDKPARCHLPQGVFAFGQVARTLGKSQRLNTATTSLLGLCSVKGMKIGLLGPMLPTVLGNFVCIYLFIPPPP